LRVPYAAHNTVVFAELSPERGRGKSQKATPKISCVIQPTVRKCNCGSQRAGAAPGTSPIVCPVLNSPIDKAIARYTRAVFMSHRVGVGIFLSPSFEFDRRLFYFREEEALHERTSHSQYGTSCRPDCHHPDPCSARAGPVLASTPPGATG